ncbi:MAG: protein-L-isoaspartate(D-aspartate) O-methyltransferase [Candidatus Hydrogenedentota bacterium]
MTSKRLDDTRAQRQAMISEQLQKRGIKDVRVLDAMRRMPRHIFVPESIRSKAYDDNPLPIACKQTISQPYIVANMLELLELQPDDLVLEIGTGSGYQTALLSLLCADVVSVERHRGLSKGAANALKALGLKNVDFRVGDGTLGAPDAAPFSAIIVTAGGPHVPDSLREQLGDGGRLICPVGKKERQKLILVQRTGDAFNERKETPCRFVPLIGDEGWSP